MNDEETGFLDRLRKGEITLYQSEDESKYRGILRPVSINANTTGGIVDIKGKSSYPWDVIKIIITKIGNKKKVKILYRKIISPYFNCFSYSNL